MKDNIQKDWAHLIGLFLNIDEKMSPADFCKMHDVTIYEMDLTLMYDENSWIS